MIDPTVSEPAMQPRFVIQPPGRVEYGYASPSRRVTWSNFLDDEVPMSRWGKQTVFSGSPARPVPVWKQFRRLPLVAILLRVARSARVGIFHSERRGDCSIEGNVAVRPRVLPAGAGSRGRFGDAGQEESLAPLLPAARPVVAARVQRGGGTVPELSFDDDDLMDWDVDFTPPPAPTRTVKLRLRRVGSAPIPTWDEE